MKKIRIAVIVIAFGMQLNAQDLIVTSKNDSINAKITKIKRGMIHFRFMKAKELRKTLLPLSEVEAYEKGFYDSAEIPKDIETRAEFVGKRFHIGTNAGFAFRTAKVRDLRDDRLMDHRSNLKSGFNWGLDAYYFIKETLAFGIKFNSFKSKGVLEDVLVFTRTGDSLAMLNSKVAIDFIGPSLVTRLVSANKKNALLLSSSIGYISYKTEDVIGFGRFTSKGGSIGVTLDIGYDFGITDYMSFGILTSWTVGALNKLEINNGFSTDTVDLEEPEGLSRINISGGLRFYL